MILSFTKVFFLILSFGVLFSERTLAQMTCHKAISTPINEDTFDENAIPTHDQRSILMAMMKPHLTQMDLIQNLNDLFDLIGFTTPAVARQQLILELTSVPPEFLKTLFSRIIGEYWIPSSNAPISTPKNLATYLRFQAKELSASLANQNDKGMIVLIHTLGFLRRGAPLPPSTIDINPRKNLKMTQTLGRWGFPFHGSNQKIEERGNGVILHILTHLNVDLQQELFSILDSLDKKHVDYFFNEIFELPWTMDLESLQSIKTYPDLFIESMLWDPFYNPLVVAKEQRKTKILERAQKKIDLVVAPKPASKIREGMAYFLAGGDIERMQDLLRNESRRIDSLIQIWQNHLNQHNLELIRNVVAKMESWPPFYKQLLIKHFFAFSEDGQLQIQPLNSQKLRDVLNFPEEVILLNDPEALKKLSSTELRALHLKILDLPTEFTDASLHPTLWVNPIPQSLRILSEMGDGDREIQKALRKMEAHENPLIKISAQLGLLRTGQTPKSFKDMLETYKKDPQWLLPHLVRAHFHYPLNEYLKDPIFRDLILDIQRSAKWGGASRDIFGAMLEPNNFMKISPRWAHYFMEDFNIRLSSPSSEESSSVR